MLRPIICCILSLLLSSCSLVSGGSPERVVSVKIIADSNIRQADPRWREEIETKAQVAADFFEREFGIVLSVRKIQPLETEQKIGSTAELLRLLKAKVPLADAGGEYDLVIGFTRLPGRIMRGHARVDEIGDCRRGLGNYVAISATERASGRDPDSALGNTDVQSLIHELGHIFGAEHVEDRNSLMAVHFNPYSDFDLKNRQTILANKFCPFRKG